jgi:hypothetical protein
VAAAYPAAQPPGGEDAMPGSAAAGANGPRRS